MNKSEFLNGLREEYRQWEALLDQIGEARMDQSGVADDWSIKDIVAHLTGWRRRTVARLQAAQRGEGEPPPYWPAYLQLFIFSLHRRSISVSVYADAGVRIHEFS